MEFLQFINQRKKVIFMPLLSVIILLSMYLLVTESSILAYFAQLGR